MKSHFPIGVLILGLSLLCSGDKALGDANSCDDCHKNEMFRVWNKKLYNYYVAWQNSPHYKAGTKCFNCHGGDPTARQKDVAHPAHLSIKDPLSNVYYLNVTSTCGHCHERIAKNFMASRHYKKLARGEGPHCVTCHNPMRAHTSIEQIVETACLHCHESDRDDVRASDIKDELAAAVTRMNWARGYFAWLPHSSLPNKESLITSLMEEFHSMAARGHRFNLPKTLGELDKLTSKLKALYMQAEAE